MKQIISLKSHIFLSYVFFRLEDLQANSFYFRGISIITEVIHYIFQNIRDRV